MKKSLIALAVAGAMTAPIVAQADATLYGSFRMGLSFQDGEDADLRDESTRIGIKGTVDLGLEDTKGLYHWEANFSTTDDYAGTSTGNIASRLAYMGATGSWGTALVGRQYHPHYTMIQSHTNIFNSADGEFGEAFSLSNKHHKREQNTLAYASPVMGGFQVVAGAVIAADGSDSNNNFDDDVDGYNIGAQFTGVKGLRVSAAYGNVEADVATAASASTDPSDFGTITPASVAQYESELWGLGATYTIDAVTVAAKYEEREDTTNGAAEELTVWELAGIYQMGSTALKARFGNLEIEDATSTEDGDQWGVEVEQKLGNRGRVWVGYTDIDAEVASGAEDTLILGYRLDF